MSEIAEGFVSKHLPPRGASDGKLRACGYIRVRGVGGGNRSSDDLRLHVNYSLPLR